MSYVPTTKQVVDILTKGLHKKQFDYLISKLTMEDIFKWSFVVVVAGKVHPQPQFFLFG
jgi:hypothetical protein